MIDSVPERIRQQPKDHGLCNFPSSSGVSIYAILQLMTPPVEMNLLEITSRWFGLLVQQNFAKSFYYIKK